jgi:hypothetical protein
MKRLPKSGETKPSETTGADSRLIQAGRNQQVHACHEQRPNYGKKQTSHPSKTISQTTAVS